MIGFSVFMSGKGNIYKILFNFICHVAELLLLVTVDAMQDGNVLSEAEELFFKFGFVGIVFFPDYVIEVLHKIRIGIG